MKAARLHSDGTLAFPHNSLFFKWRQSAYSQEFQQFLLMRWQKWQQGNPCSHCVPTVRHSGLCGHSLSMSAVLAPSITSVSQRPDTTWQQRCDVWLSLLTGKGVHEMIAYFLPCWKVCPFVSSVHLACSHLWGVYSYCCQTAAYRPFHSVEQEVLKPEDNVFHTVAYTTIADINGHRLFLVAQLSCFYRPSGPTATESTQQWLKYCSRDSMTALRAPIIYAVQTLYSPWHSGRVKLKPKLTARLIFGSNWLFFDHLRSFMEHWRLFPRWLENMTNKK